MKKVERRIKCAGLYLNRNDLSVPEGACSRAENVVFESGDLVRSRRGDKIIATLPG